MQNGPAKLLVAASFFLFPICGFAQVRILADDEFDRINVRTPQAIQLKLEQMQGSKDFERIYDFKPGSRFRRFSKPVGRLKVKARDREGRTGTMLCTASVVSAEYIITNYHCIPGLMGTQVLAAKLELGYLNEFDTSSVREFKVASEPTEADGELDYAIVKVFGNPSLSHGVIRIGPEAVEERDAVFLIHHPEGSPLILSRKQCYVTKAESGEISHTCDTMGGSSGSPLFSDETQQVVGLHFAGAADRNVGRSMERIVGRSRLLAAIVAQATDAAPAQGGEVDPSPQQQVSPPPSSEETPPQNGEHGQIQKAADFMEQFEREFGE